MIRTRPGDPPVLVIDFRYRDAQGRRCRFRQDASVQTRTAAKAEDGRLQALAAATGSPTGAAPSETMSAFLPTFERLYMSTYREATRVRYRALLRQGIVATFGARRMSEITPQALRAFGTSLRCNPRGHMNLLRTLFRCAVDAGALDRAPEVPKLGKVGRKLPDAPGDDEVAEMLRAAGKPSRISRRWVACAIVLAFDAGLRSGEIRALEVGDIDFKAGVIRVVRAMSEGEEDLPKSGHARLVPLTRRLRAVLETACKGKFPKSRVVLNTLGRTPARQQLYGAVQALQDQHDLPRRSVHLLRHGFVSRLIRGGVSVEVVRVLAGHSSIGVTQQYVHAGGGELVEAMRSIEDE